MIFKTDNRNKQTPADSLLGVFRNSIIGVSRFRRFIGRLIPVLLFTLALGIQSVSAISTGYKGVCNNRSHTAVSVHIEVGAVQQLHSLDRSQDIVLFESEEDDELRNLRKLSDNTLNHYHALKFSYHTYQPGSRVYAASSESDPVSGRLYLINRTLLI